MRTSVERLRLGLLVGAALLVLIIAACLGYARYRVGRVVANLPGKLGATITRESNGYTYSQSDGKRTIFTIHAAKAMEHTNGKFTLHDVSMILYGHSGDRADRISGDEFEYDTKAQVVRAVGVVHLDLNASAPGEPGSDGREHPASASPQRENAALDGHVVHVKTSGLVYTKNSGTATTDQALEFAFGGYTGHALGAVYNASTGHIALQSDVSLSGVANGRPIALRASHGELDRTARRADFKDARYSSAGEVAQADDTQVHMREDNSIEDVDCTGNVALADASHGRVNSQRAEFLFNASSRPVSGALTGGVHFVQEQATRAAQGDAERATLDFDARGHVDHTVLRGHVKTTERDATFKDEKVGRSERTLTSDTLELWLATTDTERPPELRDAKATGGVTLFTEEARSASDGTSRRFSGEMLTAHFVPGQNGSELSTVHGSGKTLVEQKTPDGVLQKSYGDVLDATFRQTSDGSQRSTAKLASLVQQGGVTMERSLPGKTGGSDPELQHATAHRAAFDAAKDLLTLSGDVAMHDAGRQVIATTIVIARATGNATAEGGVKVTYQSAGSEEPAHVLAARAELDHAAGKAVFYGQAGAVPARLWQAGTGGRGGSQVEAPVLILEGARESQKNSRLTARAEKAGVQGAVHATLAEANPHNPKADGSPSKVSGSGAARITSSEMVYSELDRRVQFTGGVRMVDGASQVTAESADVFLAEPESSRSVSTSKNHARDTAPSSVQGAGANGLLGGSVERVVATRHIEISQPGRKATGERLVYTAADQMFVLTGTSAIPPKVVDAVHGSTTGAELRLHSGDNNVVVSGGGPAQKVETETRVKQ